MTYGLVRLLQPTMLLATLAISACGFNKSGLVNPELLQSVGWQDVTATIQAKEFANYAEAIQAEVQRARVPFAAASAIQEIASVSPAEIAPAAECKETAGIAILVHGLSDTAFSMRDLAQVMSGSCYRARTALLPGHGTRSGDLLTTRLKDWAATVKYLVDQAAAEHERVVVVGLSLGALLTTTEALQPDSPVDAIISVSPAFYISTYRLARLTPWIHRLRPWLDKEKPDDAFRYEAIPTVAVAETVRAIKRFHQKISEIERVETPWLIVQSLQDRVIVPDDTATLFIERAANQASRLMTFHSNAIQPEQRYSDKEPRATEILAHSERYRITGLTHIAIHQSPENRHYGLQGQYRNCGIGGPRPREDVALCQQAEHPWSGAWGEKAPDNGPYALSSYNPHFDKLASGIREFLDSAFK